MAVPRMNCQTPRALARDSAVGLNALSISGTYARSSGRPSARKTFWIIGRYWAPRDRPSARNSRSRPWKTSTQRRTRSFVGIGMSWVVGLEILGHGLHRGQLRRGGVEGLDGEQLVDGRRLGPSLGEAVPGRQRLLFEDGNAVHQPIEMLAHPEVGVDTLGCLEQHVQGSVELVPGAFEVAKRQLLLAGLEMSIRTRERPRTGSSGGAGAGGHGDGRCGRRGRDLRHLRRVAGGAA